MGGWLDNAFVLSHEDWADGARYLWGAIFNESADSSSDKNSGKSADTNGTPNDPNNPDQNDRDDKATVLQTGGNVIEKRTANGLNKYFDKNLDRREWGRAVEELKKNNDLRNDYHGRIMSNGDYVSPQGSVIDNIGGYIQ